MSSEEFATPTSPAWSNVTPGAPVCNGSCKKIKCKSCKLVFSGNALRIRSHYIKCTATPEDIRDWARGAAKRHKEIKKHKDIAKNLDSKLQGDDDCATQLRIDEGLLGKKKTSRSLVDEKFAAWIYNTMQSFDVAGHDLKELISYIIKYAPKDYVPPTVDRIRGELLDAAYERTRETANALFGDLENKTALTIMSGGKTNNGKVPIVNYIAMSPGGNHFLGADDMSRAEKDCASMAKYLHEKCVGTGHERSFYLCVLDGALRSAFPHLERKMPWITCIWCSCHIISLFFKDCFGADKGVPSLVEALAKVKRVVHFIRDRQKPLGIYRSIAKKALMLPGETRYGSAVLTIMRFVTQIDACDEMFSCAEYKKWLKTQDRDVQSESAACRAIANDPAFGSFCAEIADFFDPTIVLLRRCDSEVPNLSKVYPGSKLALRTMETKTEDYDFADACIDKYKVREKELIKPVHCAAYACDPESIDHKQVTLPECTEGFVLFVEKIYPGDVERQASAIMGLSAFNNRDGVFGREVALSAAKKMPGYRWAQSFSGAHPDFQRAQVILQSLFTAQSPTERNHKMEALIKTKVRNRLKSETTNKLLYVCANNRLNTKTTAVLYCEDYMGWLQADPDSETAIPLKKQKELVKVKQEVRTNLLS